MLQKAFKFLKEKKYVSFATSKDDEPYIRVFEIMDILDNKICFATFHKKEVYKQLEQNQIVEILAFDEKYSVRVKGKMQKIDNENICKKLYEKEENLIFRELYSDFNDLVYFYLVPSELIYYDLTQRPPVTKKISF